MHSRVVREAVVITVLFVASALWGARYVTSFVANGGQPSFYQHYFEPAVMLACGHGFTVADVPRPQIVDDFLFQRTDSVDCDRLPESLAVNTRDVYQYAWLYLMGLVGVTWTIVGVSWSALTPLFGILFGLVIVLAYSIFRTVVPQPLAVAAAVLLSLSSLHLQNLPHLRDYAKAPFVLALVLILFWLVRLPFDGRRLLALATAYGIVLGIGYGFRTDLLANVPPLIVTIALFLPDGVRQHVGVRLAAIAVALAMFVVVSWPAASYVVRSGGCQWHAALLGMSDRFTSDLHVTPSVYDWVPAFSDEYLHAAVSSTESRMTGGGPLEYCSAGYDAATGRMLRDILTRFPADALTRAYASMGRIIDLPFYWWDSSSWGSASGILLKLVVRAAGLSVVVLVIGLGVRSLRLGLFALCVVVYFGGYPSMQFSNRHYFHLEFIGWMAMAFVGWHLLRLLVEARRDGVARLVVEGRRHALRAAAFAAACALALALPLFVLRAIQHREALALIQSLLDAPRAEVPMAASADGTSLMPADGAIDFGSDQRGVAYLDLHVDLQACPRVVHLGVRYDSSRPPYDFSAPVDAQPPGSIPERILLPVYRFFSGFALPPAEAGCISRVERLQSTQGLPLLPQLTLPRDWQGGRLHQALRYSSRWTAWFES